MDLEGQVTLSFSTRQSVGFPKLHVVQGSIVPRLTNRLRPNILVSEKLTSPLTC